MPKPAWEDLGEFLDTEEFASTAVFTLLDSSTLPPVVGIFTDPYEGAQAGEYRADTEQTCFACPEAALAGVERGCTVVITSPGYSPRTMDVLTDPQSDGAGLAVVMLAPPAE